MSEPTGHVYDRCACDHARHWHRGGTADCDRCGCDVFEPDDAEPAPAAPRDVIPAEVLATALDTAAHLDDADGRAY